MAVPSSTRVPSRIMRTRVTSRRRIPLASCLLTVLIALVATRNDEHSNGNDTPHTTVIVGHIGSSSQIATVTHQPPACSGGFGLRGVGACQVCTGDECYCECGCNMNSCTCAVISCLACAYTGSWTWGAYGGCSTSCGDGLRWRSATCTGGTCAPGSQPADTSQSCNITPCYTGSWSWGSYGGCSAACGGGLQWRSAVCSGGACAPGSQPADTSQSCNTNSCTGPATCGAPGTCNCVTTRASVSCTCSYQSCPDMHSDTSCAGQCSAACTYGSYSGCTAGCGPQSATRIPTCTWSDGQGTALGNCGGCTDTSTSCGRPNCVQWETTGFGACNVGCGAGTQTRANICRDTTAGALVDNSICQARLGNPTALLSQWCESLTACSWDYSAWGTCSLPCGTGSQSRSTICRDSSRANLDMGDTSYCTRQLSTAPLPLSQVCNTVHCFVWDTTAWGACDRGCGIGLQTRTNTCRDTTIGGSPLTVNSDCQSQKGNPVLPLSQSCPGLNCAWQVQTVPAWRACSVTCSYGNKERDVWCQDGVTGVPSPSEAWCVDPKPPTVDTCYTACTNNYLASFTITSQVSFPFNKLTPAYTVQVPWGVLSSVGTAAPEDPTAIMTWNTQSVSGLANYPAASQSIVVTVTSQAGVPRVYSVAVQRQPSFNAYLATLTPSVGTWDSLLSLTSVFTYYLTVPNLSTEVSFSATLADTTGQITGWVPDSAPMNLVVFPTTRTITVNTLAQDGTTTRAYSIVITRLRSAIATLLALDVTSASTARMTPDFATLQPAYLLSGRLGPSITVVRLTATRENAQATLTYTLSHSGGTVVGPVAFTALAGQDVPIFEGDMLLSIRVLAEDLTTAAIYTCGFTKVSSDSKLSGMTQTAGTINTPLVPGSTPTAAYTLTLPFGATSLTVVPTMRNAFANGVFTFQGATSVKFGGATVIPALALPTVGDFSLELRITSEDLSTLTTYAITIHRQSNDARLSDLQAQADFTTVYQQSTRDYTLNLASAVSQLTLTATPAHNLATLKVQVGAAAFVSMARGVAVTVIAAGALSIGDTLVRVQVFAEDGTAGSVTTVTVHRFSSDASLATLVNTAQAVTITSSQAYSLGVTSDVFSFNARPQPASPLATVTYQYGGSATALPYSIGDTISPLPLEFGANLLWVTVTSEDGAVTKTYAFTIRRSSGDATLSAMTLANGAVAANLIPAFLSNVPAYSTTVGAATNSLAVTCTPTWSGSTLVYGVSSTNAPASATYSASSTLALSTGTNFVFVRVTSEDGVLVAYYTTTVGRLSTATTLSALTTTAVAPLTPTFVPGTLAYSVNVLAAVPSVGVSFARTDARSTITYSWNSGLAMAVASGTGSISGLTLVMGANTLTLLVQSEDTTAQSIYRVIVHRLSPDSTLASLTIGDANLQPAFAPSTLDYSVTVPSAIASAALVALSAFPAAATQLSTNGGGSYATLASAGSTLTLPTGVTAVRVRVTAEDGTITVYSIAISRQSADSTLTAVSGVWTYLTPASGGWSATRTQYRVRVPATAATLATIGVTQGNAAAATTYSVANSASAVEVPFVGSISQLPLQAGENTLLITCVSEDATSSTVYSITIHRVSDKSNLANLTPIFGSFNVIFEPTRTAYSVALASTVTQFSLLPVAPDSLCTITASVTLSGTSLPSAGSYSAVANGGSTPTLTLPFGTSLVTVQVLAEDGTTQSLYLVTVHRISSDASLASLTAAEGPITPTGAGSFLLRVGPGVTTVTVTPTRSYALATPSFAFASAASGTDGGNFTPMQSGTLSIPPSAILLTPGDNTLTVRVEAEDGTTVAFTIIVIHRVGTESALRSLTLDPPLPLFVFDPTTTEYSLRVSFGVTTLAWSADAASALVTSISSAWNILAPVTQPGAVRCAGAGDLTLGANTLVLTVRAEDGTTTRTYMVRVYRINRDSQLAGLAFTPDLHSAGFEFQPNQIDYAQVSVDGGVDSIRFTPTTAVNALSTITYSFGAVGSVASAPLVVAASALSGPITLPTGDSQIAVTVVAEDGATMTYTISVRRVSTDCTLAGVTMRPAGFGFSPQFAPAVRAYSNQVSNAVSTTSFSALINHPRATAELLRSNSGGAWTSVLPLQSGLASATQLLPIGRSDWLAQVTAEDAVTVCKYELAINRLSNDASLSGSGGGIQVAGLTAAGVSTSLDGVISPAFSASQRAYTLVVLNPTQALTIRVATTDPTATVTYTRETTARRLLVSACASADLPLQTVSAPIALAAGATFVTVTIISGDRSAQTVYTIAVTRASDLTSVSLTGLPNGLAVPTSPVFTPGQPKLEATVAYKVESFCVSTIHATTHPSWNVSATGTTKETTVTLPASGSACSALLSLAVGVNTFALADPIDPALITLQLTRASSVINTMTFTVSAGSTLFLAPTAFKSATRAYSGSTVFVSSETRLLATFTSGTASVSIEGNPAVQSVPVLSGVTALLPLRVGPNVLVLTHSLDGVYTTTLTRAQPDVSMIRLDGTHADGTVQTGLTMSPAFVGGVLTYTVAVPSVVRSLTATPTFDTAQSLVFTHSLAGGASPSTSASGTATAALTLSLGDTTLTFTSVRDGAYVLVVTRGEADVGGVILTGQHWDGGELVLATAPSFTPGSLVQRAVTIVPKAILTFTITATFDQVGTVHYTLPLAGASPVSLEYGKASAPIPLSIGLNTVTVVSTKDGAYPFSITRAAADISSVSVAGVAQEGVSRSINLSPALFRVDTRSYSVAVPYRTHRVVFTSAFLTPGSVTLAGGVTATTLALVSTQSSDALSLGMGANTLALTSASGLDGAYSYSINRASPDIASVEFTLISSTAAGWLGPAPVFDSSVYAYSGHRVPYAVSALHLAAVFVTPTTFGVSLNGGAALRLVSGTPRALALEVGSNTIEFTSDADGIYRLTIDRSPVDVSSIELTGFDQSLSQVYAPAVPNTLSPDFAPVTRQYDLTVGSIVRSVRVRVTTASDQANTMELTQAGASTVQSLLLESSSATLLLDLQPGLNIFTIDSLLDGAFTVRVLQSPPDMLRIRVVEPSDPLVELALVPAYTPGVYEYECDVPFGIDLVALSFTHQHLNSSLQTQIDGVSFESASVTSVADGTSSDLDSNVESEVQSSLPATSMFQFVLRPLPVVQTYRVLSTYDSAYKVTVRRALPDIRGVRMQIHTLGEDVAGQSSVQLLPSALIRSDTRISPEFTAETRQYTLELPHTAIALQLAVEFDTPESATLYAWSGLGFSFAIAPSQLLVSQEYSNSIPLRSSAQRLVLTSASDRTYIIVVTRSRRDVSPIAAQEPNRACSGLQPQVQCGATAVTVEDASDSDSPLRSRIDVPWVTRQLQLVAAFLTPDSLSLLDSTQSQVQPLITAAWSQWLTLLAPTTAVASMSSATHLTTYYLSSVQDGLYSVEVHRAYPDLQQIRLSVDGVTCTESSGSLLQSMLLSPLGPSQIVYQPDSYSYLIAVPYAVTSLELTAEFGSQWADNTVALNQVNSRLTDSQVYLPLRAGYVTSGLALEVGSNTFTFRSAADGKYTVVVTRALLSVTGISPLGLSGGTDALATTFSLEPPFTRSSPIVYSLNLPPAVVSLAWTITSVDTADQLILVDSADGGRYTLVAGTASESPSFVVADDVPELAFTLLSLRDGCYPLSVTHAAPSAVQRVLMQQRVHYGMLVVPAARSLQHAHLSDSAALAYDSTFGVALAAVNGSQSILPLGTSFDESTSELTSPLALTPSFIGGWLGPYSTRVSSGTASVSLNLGFRSDATSADTPACTLNGVPFKLSGDVLAQCAVGAGQTFSSECVNEVPLQSGLNTFACVTTDGTYEFSLTRGTGVWQAAVLPETLYANELLSGLRLVQSGLTIAVDDLNVDLLVSAGSVTPAAWQFGGDGAESAAAEFSYRAPAAVTAPTVVYLTHVASGHSAWQYPPATIAAVTVLPQATVTIAGVAARYYSAQRTATIAPIRVTLSEAPRRGRTLTVTIALIEIVTGANAFLAATPASIAELTFTSLDGASPTQSFEFTMPVRTAAETALALTFTFSGDDVEHYTPVAVAPLTLIAQANFVLGSLPASIYVSKRAVLTLAPSVVPDVDTHVRVRVTGAGGYVTDDTAPISIEATLLFPAGSSSAAPFVYHAPLTFSGDGVFTLSFDVVESHDHQYLPIPSHSSRLIAPVAITVEGAPQSILNRETSAPIILRIASIPLSEVTYTFRSDLADVQFTPPSLTFRAIGASGDSSSADLAQTFTVSAPYWYPRSSSAVAASHSPILNVDLLVTGPDAPMFTSAPPTPVRITLAPQPAVVDGVSFYLRASDGKELLLSSGLSPFLGNTFEYAYDLAVAVMDPSRATTGSSQGGQLKQTRGVTSASAAQQESLVQSMRGMVSRTLATATGSNPTAAYSSANVSLAMLPVFSSGELTLALSYAADSPDPSLASSTVSHSLSSGVRTPWVALSPGKQTFTLSSTLDGNYSFSFAATMLTNPEACMAQANRTVFGLPTESFTQPGIPVPESDLIPTEGASAAPFLICATITDIAAAAKLLTDASAQSSSTLAFSLSSSPATSWLFLLALLAYCLMSLGAGHNLGAGKALAEEAEHAQRHVPTVQSYLALSSAAGSSAMIKRMDKSVSMASGANSWTVAVVASLAPVTVAAAPQLSLPAALSSRLRLALPLSSLVLVLCVLRCVAMLVYYYFFESLSVPAVRLLTGAPHVLLPWILTAVMQQLPQLVQATLGGRHHLSTAACFRTIPRLALGLLTALTVGIVSAYAWMVAAPPASNRQTLVDTILLGGVSLICCNQLMSLTVGLVTLHRLLPKTNVESVSQVVQPHGAAGSVAAAVRRADVASAPVSLASLIRPKVTPGEAASARLTYRLLAVFVLASVVCAGALLLSVTWSGMYQQEYLQYVLLITVAEVAALGALLYSAHASLATQRVQLQQFIDVGTQLAHDQAHPRKLRRRRSSTKQVGSVSPTSSPRLTTSPAPTRTSTGPRACLVYQSPRESGELSLGSLSHSQSSDLPTLSLGPHRDREDSTEFDVAETLEDLLPGSPALAPSAGAWSPPLSPTSASAAIRARTRLTTHRFKSLQAAPYQPPRGHRLPVHMPHLALTPDLASPVALVAKDQMLSR